MSMSRSTWFWLMRTAWMLPMLAPVRPIAVESAPSTPGAFSLRTYTVRMSP